MFSRKAVTKQSAGKVKRVHQRVHHSLSMLQTVYFLLRKIISLCAPSGLGFVTFYYGKPNNTYGKFLA